MIQKVGRGLHSCFLVDSPKMQQVQAETPVRHEDIEAITQHPNDEPLNTVTEIVPSEEIKEKAKAMMMCEDQRDPGQTVALLTQPITWKRKTDKSGRLQRNKVSEDDKRYRGVAVSVLQTLVSLFQEEVTNKPLFSSILFILLLTLSTLSPNLLIVLLKGRQILPSLRELPFLHALPHIPVHKGPLRVHQVKLVVNPRKHLSNTSRVGDHAHSPLHLRQVTTRDHSWGLVIDATLESSRTPVHKLDCALCLDSGNSCIHILGDNITSVHEAASHVLSVARVALDHHGRRLEGRVGNFSHG
ncbi:RNA-binding (RRM/RBD/RNP motifs) family protein [Striga asiatica]|uniref:RNA-binding (RRM/RBD/RNP motifs) family protein n=1 Tax=Striga asiatica TaxID=4170 RepID=A0A5A7Q8X9_STRAF|nr:RNA-binding (RRM/RBD/RNP motifs) family protein [Striga asiatica]